MFTVGQEVISSNHGKGVVTAIDEDALLYPVEVTFYDGRVDTYTAGGREFVMQENPTLAAFE